MLWIKSFHIVLVASWFAGLFYLPRIFVNLAMETDATATTRLLLMARKLYRFTGMLSIFAVLTGVWLWQGYGFSGGWLHAKLALVVLVLGYHHACRSLLRRFEQFANVRSERWVRVFNEVSVLLFIGITVLVVVKPF